MEGGKGSPFFSLSFCACLFIRLLHLFLSSCSCERPTEKSIGERVLDNIYFPRTQTANNIDSKQADKNKQWWEGCRVDQGCNEIHRGKNVGTCG